MTEKIKMLSFGLGRNARSTIQAAIADPDIEVLPYAAVGNPSEIYREAHGMSFETIGTTDSKKLSDVLGTLRREHGDFVVVDNTHPDAILDNLSIVAQEGFPIVVGTTTNPGMTRDHLAQVVAGTQSVSVIDSNMLPEIVRLFHFIETETPIHDFVDCGLYVLEAHQCNRWVGDQFIRGKVDPSGTARKMVDKWDELDAQVNMIRDDRHAQAIFNIPDADLPGFGAHLYRVEAMRGYSPELHNFAVAFDRAFRRSIIPEEWAAQTEFIEDTLANDDNEYMTWSKLSRWSPGGRVQFSATYTQGKILEIQHTVLGREGYGPGFVAAIKFASQRWNEAKKDLGPSGASYDMADVLGLR